MSSLKAGTFDLRRSLSNSSRRGREERHHEFHRFLEKNVRYGIDGYKKQAKFNSPAEVKAWWEQPGENLIARALKSGVGCPAVTTVRNGYLIIFSILSYCGMAQYIGEFTRRGWQDHRLPLLDAAPFGDDPQMVDVMNAFCTHQWRFCPVIFSRNSRMDERFLEPQQILPIERQESLGPKATSAKSVIRKVKLYEDCCDQEWCHGSTIVLKEYQTHNNDVFRRAWLQECSAFVSIESGDTIIKYLGSFEQNGRCFIALEYANGGSLRDLFKKNERPKTAREVACFWKALMGLFKAINHIHNLGPRSDSENTAFAHRDINPSNILVFQNEREPFLEKFAVKLADFDTSTSTQAIGETKLAAYDNNGSRTYSAPETSRFYAEQERDTKQLPFNCDVWSLGCVLSEALIWLSNGMEAIQEAERQRTLSIAKDHPNIIGSGYDACFHDGKEVLPSVLDSHRVALRTLQPFDAFSRSVRDLIEKQMLVPILARGGARSDPMDVWDDFTRMIRAATPGSQGPLNDSAIAGPSSPSAADIPPPIRVTYSENQGHAEVYNPSPVPYKVGPPVPNYHPPPSRASDHGSISTTINPGTENPRSLGTQDMWKKLTVDDVDHYRQYKEKKDLPGYNAFRRGIHPRHFIIIIDDSESMRREERDVFKTAEALLWVLKEIDSEGVEVRFTSDPNRRYPSKTWAIRRQSTKQLMKTISEHFRGGDLDRWCNMENALNSIFSDHVVDPKRPTSVYIFTDGMWGPGMGASAGKQRSPGDVVEGALLEVVRRMEQKGMRRTAFSVQFISFGNNEIGLKILDYLDDEAPYMDSNGRRMDIVDHKGWRDNFWAILWGAVNESNDNVTRMSMSIRNGISNS